MISKIKIGLVTLLLSFGLVAVFQLATTQTSSAQLFSGAKSEACKGTQLDETAGGDCVPAEGRKLNNLIEDIINILSIVIGIIAVVMIIINGLRFIVAGGDSSSISSARNGIIYAIVGLLFVAFAQVIVKFVLTEADGVANPAEEGASLVRYVAITLMHML